MEFEKARESTEGPRALQNSNGPGAAFRCPGPRAWTAIRSPPRRGLRLSRQPNGGFPTHLTYNEGMLASDVLDSVLTVADDALRTLFAPAQSVRKPALPADSPLTEVEKRQAAALMRVNHAGEIAAQGLYRGQAALSRSRTTREFMQRAAGEEGDHLAWCEHRLHELGSRPSRFNPVWYLGSFVIGAAAALFGDALSMGFVTETERQVEGHLASHLDRLPASDQRSRQIVELMKSDEAAHAQAARAAGAAALPEPIPTLMRVAARVMTGTAYWV
jgi:ubiquinone biosynthesis monooxygenase Coq7